MRFTRRRFLATLPVLASLPLSANTRKYSINTTSGPISTDSLGTALIHEHVLVDFIGAAKTNFDRWNRESVVKIVLPFLLEAKRAGVKSFFDCTPNFLGRDVMLLQLLASQSGLTMITNTGYYGAVGNKYLPEWAFTDSDEELATRWINEFESGIDNTNVKPGFIKIGVDSVDGGLSDVHKKLVRAAAITHLTTGLTICSHTGPSAPAMEEIQLLQKSGVHPSAFVWVHAQAEKNKEMHLKIAQLGSWVSLDGIGWGDFDNYADSIHQLKSNKLLHRVLISHDAGWYKPDEPTGEFKGYTNIFTELIPRLMKKGFTAKDVDQLLVKNPAEAMGMRVRRI
jgi:phosphotriesterase-related protein